MSPPTCVGSAPVPTDWFSLPPAPSCAELEAKTKLGDISGVFLHELQNMRPVMRLPTGVNSMLEELRFIWP